MAKKRYKRHPNRPINLVVVNADSADLRDTQHSINILKRVAPIADVILGDECFNMDVKEILPEFHVAQFGRRGSSEATNIVAVRRTRGRIVYSRSVLGAPADPGSDVRARYWLHTKIQVDDMKPRKFSAGHAQPKRAWSMWDRYMLRAPGGTLGLDTNKLKRAIVVRFPFRKVRQVGLLAAILPRFIPASRARAVSTGGDHKAVHVTLWK